MPEENAEREYYILFQLRGTTYGIISNHVQQMEMIEHITPVPNAPPFVEGLVFLRGQVIPVINLRLRFGFEKAEYDIKTRLIVVNKSGRVVGLIVDSAREFVSIPKNIIVPPPDTISGLSGKYLEGIASIGERLILIINVDEVLNFAEAIKPYIQQI